MTGKTKKVAKMKPTRIVEKIAKGEIPHHSTTRRTLCSTKKDQDNSFFVLFTGRNVPDITKRLVIGYRGITPPALTKAVLYHKRVLERTGTNVSLHQQGYRKAEVFKLGKNGPKSTGFRLMIDKE